MIPTKTIRIHYFDDTGEAYDACNCNSEIAIGDILVIPSERVVGVADAWPIAVTKEHGALHYLVGGATHLDLDDGADDYRNGAIARINAGLDLARVLCDSLLKQEN